MTRTATLLAPLRKLPQIRAPLLSNPFVNAFIYGLLYGPIALPCFGLLLVLSFLSAASQRWIVRQFTLHGRLINVIGGLLLIGIGAFDSAILPISAPRL